MNPDNNPKRKWERMFPMSCKMHLSCTALLLQLCRPTDLHTNSFIPSSGSGGSAPLLACSPLTCALSNHCSGVQTFIPKTKTRVEIQPVPIKGPAEKPPLRNCLRKRSTPHVQTTSFMLCWEYTTHGGCITLRWISYTES